MSISSALSQTLAHTRHLVHRAVRLLTSHLSLLLIVPTTEGWPGWVDLVYPSADGHPSKYYFQLMRPTTLPTKPNHLPLHLYYQANYHYAAVLTSRNTGFARPLICSVRASISKTKSGGPTGKRKLVRTFPMTGPALSASFTHVIQLHGFRYATSISQSINQSISL